MLVSNTLILKMRKKMYRNMKNKILGGLMLVLVLCFTACEDEQLFGRDGNTTIRISATAKFSGAESRAVLATEYKATENNVFMLYKGTDKNATLEVMEAMTSLEGTIENVLIEDGATYTAIMIANVPKSELVLQGVDVGSKLEALYSATYAVNTTDNKPTDAAAFTWSGVVCGITTANVRNGLNFELNPNVAKVTVNITNNVVNNTEFPANQVELVNVQVRNVANDVRFAQNALSKAGLFTSANNGIDSDDDVLDYEIEELNLAPSESQTLSWYVPCNMLEPASNSGSRAQKAPNYATYIEIDGIRRLDYMDTAYKVYLGTSTGTGVDYESVGNYYVEADYQYTVNATINDDGLTWNIYNVSDKNNSTEPQKVIFPAGSNCYMVHPKAQATAGGTIYEVPLDQVNRYWGMVDGDEGSKRIIGSTTKWRPVHIWQDINKQAIYFCDENGNDITTTRTTPTNEYVTNIDFTGNQPIRFKLRDTDTYGNVVIGVRINGVDGIAWSWHLWITDYNPDAAPNQDWVDANYNYVSSGGQGFNGLWVENTQYTDAIERYGYYFTYTTSTLRSGSNVQHYTHNRPRYWSTTDVGKASAAVWDDGGIYGNSWIMDRNLGAMAPNNFDIIDPIDGYGLYYQYGRKDPFGYNDGSTYKSYDMIPTDSFSGSGEGSWKNATGGSISNSVLNPYTYYTNTGGSWASDKNAQPWYHLPTTETISRGAKTIFDPCPPGWCLPVYDTFKFAEESQNVDITTEGIYFTTSTTMTDAQLYGVDRSAFVIYWNTTSAGVLSNHKRHMAMLTMPRYKGGGYYALEACFPMQAEISTSGVVQTFAGTTDRAFMWTVDATESSGTGTGHTMGLCGYNTVSGVTNFIHDDGKPYLRSFSQQYNVKYNGRLYSYNMNASRGQAVRCIQEPNN